MRCRVRTDRRDEGNFANAPDTYSSLRTRLSVYSGFPLHTPPTEKSFIKINDLKTECYAKGKLSLYPKLAAGHEFWI
jgi:hypothetical protein